MSDLETVRNRISLVQGDITSVECDVLVNAANSSLILGGGVAGAIRRHGGESIQEECDLLAPIAVGQAVMTAAGRLRARNVIHAVGPVYAEGDEDRKLTLATQNSLILARDHALSRLAFPAVSTGIFGFPIERCSEIMLRTTLEFLRNNEYPRVVIFCLYDENAFLVFQRTWTSLVRLSSPS